MQVWFLKGMFLFSLQVRRKGAAQLACKNESPFFSKMKILNIFISVLSAQSASPHVNMHFVSKIRRDVLFAIVCPCWIEDLKPFMIPLL